MPPKEQKQKSPELWNHSNAIPISIAEFNALNNEGHLTLLAWLTQKSAGGVPMISVDAKLNMTHFRSAYERFGGNWNINAPRSSYNALFRRAAVRNVSGVITSAFAGTDQNAESIQLAKLLYVTIGEIKGMYQKGYSNFSVFVNAVMIAVEEAAKSNPQASARTHK